MAGEEAIPRELVSQLSADPSTLTTATILHEIANLRALFEIQLQGQASAFEARLDAIDRATQVFQDNLTRVPTETDRAVSRLQALQDEKFAGIAEKLALVQSVIETRIDAGDKAIKILQDISDRFPDRIDEKLDALEKIQQVEFSSIQVQFRERDVRTEAAASATKIAVDAALQAAKEAVGEQNRSSALAIAKSEAATDKRIDAIAGLISTTTKGTDDKIDDLKERMTRGEGLIQGKTETKAETHSNTGLIIAIIGIALTIISVLMVASAFIRPAVR